MHYLLINLLVTSAHLIQNEKKARLQTKAEILPLSKYLPIAVKLIRDGDLQLVLNHLGPMHGAMGGPLDQHCPAQHGQFSQ